MLDHNTTAFWLDDAAIRATLARTARPDAAHARDILAKAATLGGLDLDDVAVLTAVDDADLMQEIFHAAERVKTEIYGPRIVLFAPLYFSNICTNECVYCAFR
ncbi:hypothetical protein J8J27_23585, partial [Mycobacterium tuberculosis]|nr:hypothetical protein [Mycobacterium tuberculosis]